MTPEPPAVRRPLMESFVADCKLTAPLEVCATHRRSGRERMIVVRRPSAVVGRGPGSDVRLDHPSVSRGHAYFQVVEGAVYCADLGSRTGLVWDDGRRGPGWLTAGRTVGVGSFTLSLLGPCPPRPFAGADGTAALPTVGLEVYRGSDAPVGSCPLDWPVTLVGRHPACRLRFVDATIDYFQGCVVNTPGGVWWKSLSATTASRVNGQKVKLARLRDGDLLEIGRLTLVPRTGSMADPADGSLVRLTAAALVPAAADAAPVAQLASQIHECITAFTGLIASLQREHAAVVAEQLRQVQELTHEVKQLRVHTPSPAVPLSRPSPSPPTPSSEMGKGSQPDAHGWFLDQLAKLSQRSRPPKTS